MSRQVVSIQFLTALVLVTFVAAGLRLYQLGEPSLWTDEVNTVRTCTDLENTHVSKFFGYIPTAFTLEMLGVSLDDVRHDNIHEWQQLGVTERSIRLASAVIGIVTIPLIALAGCRVFGTRAALIIALLLAVAPWHLWMSQSGRFYSQQFLFASLCLIWYFDATARGSRRSMALSMFCLVLAFLSQPPALVIVGVFALDWMIGQIRRVPVQLGSFGWTLAILAMMICGAALAIDLTQRTEQWTQFIDAEAQRPSVLLLGAIWMIGPVLAAFAVVSTLILWREQRRAAIYWSLAAGVPIAVMVAASFNNFIHFRYMFVCLLGWLVLAGLGADRIYSFTRARFGAIASHGALVMLITSAMVVNFGYFTDGYGFRNRWKDAFSYVQEHRQPDELVISGVKARYYLEEPNVIRLHGDIENVNDLIELGQPSWIIFRADSPATARRHRWLAEEAELKAVFSTRVQQPFSSIRVYYFDPSRNRQPARSEIQRVDND